MALKLAKPGDSTRISLAKGPTPVAVNLKWANRKQGWFSRSTPDLDLGCMYELADGSKGVIQALGNLFGSKDRAPYITLDQDDRSGGADGENLVIHRPDLIRRVVLFAYIYSGSSNFKSVSGTVTLQAPGGEQIVIELDNPDANTFCALAQVTYDGSAATVTKEERYFGGHQQCDAHYGFRFSWTTASK